MNKENILNIQMKDFSSLGNISLFVRNIIKESDLKYSFPDKKQRDDVYDDIMKIGNTN